MNKKVINLVIALLVSGAIFIFGYYFGGQKNDSSLPPALPIEIEQVREVNLLINNGQFIKSFANLSLPQPPTVLGLLETISKQEKLIIDIDKSYSMGAFVKQIGDKVNGQNQMYWQYWVGGEQPMVSADNYVLQGGETVLWSFSKSKY